MPDPDPDPGPSSTPTTRIGRSDAPSVARSGSAAADGSRWSTRLDLWSPTLGHQILDGLIVGELPVPLLAVRVGGPGGGHDGAELIGSVDRVVLGRRGAELGGHCVWELGHPFLDEDWFAGPDFVDITARTAQGATYLLVRLVGRLAAVTLMHRPAWEYQSPVTFEELA